MIVLQNHFNIGSRYGFLFLINCSTSFYNEPTTSTAARRRSPRAPRPSRLPPRSSPRAWRRSPQAPASSPNRRRSSRTHSASSAPEKRTGANLRIGLCSAKEHRLRQRTIARSRHRGHAQKSRHPRRMKTGRPVRQRPRRASCFLCARQHYQANGPSRRPPMMVS
jgi:hypothetical protein